LKTSETNNKQGSDGTVWAQYLNQQYRCAWCSRPYWKVASCIPVRGFSKYVIILSIWMFKVSHNSHYIVWVQIHNRRLGTPILTQK
jgi:hypothetical protein